MAASPETLGDFLENPQRTLALDPRTVRALDLFQDMAPIPSPSGHERPMGEYLQIFAHEHGLETKMDTIGNVAIWVPATPGYHDKPGLILQAHQDGVPKAKMGKPNPAESGVHPIVLDERGEWMGADGTTLWMDNRGGITASLSVAIDETVIHPKMILLFTVREETDMGGVSNLGIPIDEKDYPAMLNLDSEDEGEIAVGSACAGYTEITIPVTRGVSTDMEFVQLQVTGTEDDRHSGVDIHKGRVNTNKLIIEILKQALREGIDFRLVDISGDNFKVIDGREVKTRNVICPEAQATLAVRSDHLEKLQAAIARHEKQRKAHYSATDPELSISLVGAEAMDTTVLPMSSDSTRLVIDTMTQLPHGVIETLDSQPHIVRTSTNVAIVHANKHELFLSVSMMTRAAEEKNLEAVRQNIADLVGNVASAIEQSKVIKGWTANDNFQMTELLHSVYYGLFGTPMIDRVFHAGLEAGEFAQLFPIMDIKSIGPTILGAHGVKERVNIPSYDKFIRLLFAVVQAYAERG